MGNPLVVRCFQPASPGLSYLDAVCRPWFNRDALRLPDLKCMKLISTLLNQGSVTGNLSQENFLWLLGWCNKAVRWRLSYSRWVWIPHALLWKCPPQSCSGSTSYVWLWGCRPLLGEQVLCLPSLWQLFSWSHPPGGWSSLFPSHPDLGANLLAVLMQISSPAPVVPSGTEEGCRWYLCVPIFSAVMEKEKPSPASPSPALAALGPGDKLEAHWNFLYVQPLAAESHVESDILLFFPYSASCWLPVVITKKEEVAWSFPMYIVYATQDFTHPSPLQHFSHHSPPICLCASGHLPFSGGASITVAVVWVVCKLAVIRRNKPTNSKDTAGCHEWFIIISSWNHLTFAITWSLFAVLESGRNISHVEHNGGHSSKQNCMYCRWLWCNFIDLKCFK